MARFPSGAVADVARAFDHAARLTASPELTTATTLDHAVATAPAMLDARCDEIEAAVTNAIAALRALLDDELPRALAQRVERLRAELVDAEQRLAESASPRPRDRERRRRHDDVQREQRAALDRLTADADRVIASIRQVGKP
jgi:hypothetical protein